MCGICGFIGWQDEDALDRMMLRLIHRGPDESGKHVEPGLALGVRRLRVIDPKGGHQPIGNETGKVWAVLNGEIYNYRELREELIDKGHRFTSNCDTEVLVHLYEEEGEEWIHRLRGMFAIALWDRERETLWVVRDRLGIKPLYYAIQDEGVIFASELPALASVLSPRSVRSEAIAQYLNLLYVPAPETIFEGVQQLLPGEILKVTDGKIETRRYWSIQGEAKKPYLDSQENLEESFLELLKESVQAHLVSDVPLGLFLSGGLDSASILAMMRKISNGPIHTFSIGYYSEADHSYNELDTARILADHFCTEHIEERLTPDVVKLLPQIVSAMGEPFGDSSAIPTYLVSEVARRSVTVALSGIGGDELFGGYPRYLGMRASMPYQSVPLGVRQWLAGSVASRLPELGQARDHLGRLKRFLQSGPLSADEQYINWITFSPTEWGCSAYTPEFREQVKLDTTLRAYRMMFEAWPSKNHADRAMGLDLQTYLPDDLLRMGDRLSMAHSLELRVPFCDLPLLGMALNLPPAIRFSGWKLKGLMRKSLKQILPQHILNRPKRGFMVPLARWLREDLREMVYDLLSEARVRRRGYVKPEYVQWLLREHESGSRNFADQLYALLVLELWHTTTEEKFSCVSLSVESRL